MRRSLRTDELSWLEEPRGERALEWVRRQNDRTIAQLTSDPRYPGFHNLALGVVNDDSRIPGDAVHDFGALLFGDWVYSLRQDERHPRGLWMRTRVSSFRTAEPVWEPLLDIDDFARTEGRDWVFQAAHPQPPHGDRALTTVVWLDENTLLLSAHRTGSDGNDSGMVGRLWLDQGGVYVSANIRGGGEFGAAWHVRGTQRRKTYEDFASVAKDLIKRGITAPKRIGVYGESAGGLLAGVMLTQHPDLLGAAVLEVPLLDQFRMDLVRGNTDIIELEYGSWKTNEGREFLLATSPFQNLIAGGDIPAPLIVTSTTDDNVSPAQARRFAARMESLSMPFFFYETPEGGHGVVSTPEQRAKYEALLYTYLNRALQTITTP